MRIFGIVSAVDRYCSGKKLSYPLKRYIFR